MTTPNLTPEATAREVKAVIEITRAVAEAIRDLGEVPSGELYARLMDKLDIRSYDFIIDTLLRAGVITRNNHVLAWVGPRKVV